MQTYIASCKKCKTVVTVKGEKGSNVEGGGGTRFELHLPNGETMFAWQYMNTCHIWAGKCACGHVMMGKLVEATVSHKNCDGRCTAAKSHKCACECGGLNHGVAHMVAC